MFTDALIDGFIRDIQRRYLDFQTADGPPGWPSPEPSKRYLLYLHVPFCTVLCPFCIFHRTRFSEDVASAYFAALRREIGMRSEAGFRFGELCIGGGTPTVDIGELAATIESVRAGHEIDCVSIETNADMLAADRVAALTDLPIDRLSVGVQSFDDTLLQPMQRVDAFGSGAQMRSRLAAAGGRFRTLNADMMFNLPGQTLASLERDIQILTEDIGVDQVSWYPVMTTSHSRRPMADALGGVDYAREKAMYEHIVARLESAGYRRSSAWCFSRRPGLVNEYVIGHDEYVGLGSGASSFIAGRVLAETHSIDDYLRCTAQGDSSLAACRRLSADEQIRYHLMIRLFSGKLDLDAAKRRFGPDFERRLSKELSALRLLRAVRRNGGRLELTERGYYLWVVIMRAFFTQVNEFRFPSAAG